MVSDAQVRLLRRRRMEGKTQEAAAAAAGMSVRAARTWETGSLPSQSSSPRHWRTRPDPFSDVWEREIVPLLERDRDGELQAKTIFDELERRHSGQFSAGQLRTLQRRVRDWRALYGPAKEVFFEQVHEPGRELAIDFTHATELAVTIQGELFEHLLFEAVLSFSTRAWADIAFGETYEALVDGLQRALHDFGGVPRVLRSDNLSAATHELRHTGGRALTKRFGAVLDHYGMTSSRITPTRAHENGVAEQRHFRTKSALKQALILRGSRDFDSPDAYRRFVRDVLWRSHNRHTEKAFAVEREHLRALPPTSVPTYTTYEPVVRRWSTIRVGKAAYSVPSRLIGHTVQVRQYADMVEVYYRGQLAERIGRLRGSGDHRIDYRHVIGSLVRKPGAFARYRYREELFPRISFRRAYDRLRVSHGDRADVEYVRILHLAAMTMEVTVDQALTRLLAARAGVDYAAVKALVEPEPQPVPQVHVGVPDLRAYDSLLAGGAL